MADYNANEKVVTLNQNLPFAAKPVQQNQSGDAYTRIGRIEGNLSDLNHRKVVQVTIPSEH